MPAPQSQRPLWPALSIGCLGVTCAAPWIAVWGLDRLAELADWRPLDSGLLPFDVLATHDDAFRAGGVLGAPLCALYLAGARRLRAYLPTGALAAVALAALESRGVMLPFWLASALVGASIGALAWLVLVPAMRLRPRWLLGLACVATLPLILFTLFMLVLDRAFGSGTSDAHTHGFPTPDGGRVTQHAWTQHGFQNPYHGSLVFYEPPGWWSRAERISGSQLGEELTDVRWVTRGEQMAAVLVTPTRSFAVKRVVHERRPSATPLPPVPAGGMRWTLPRVRWVAPLPDRACLWRGFEAPGSRARERLVEARRFHPPLSDGELAVHRPGGVRDCERPGTWRVTEIDLARDRVREEAQDLPAGALRTVISTSPRADLAWSFDLRETLDANRDLRPIPAPDVKAVVTVIAVPLPPLSGKTPRNENDARNRFVAELPTRRDALLEREGAHEVCRAEAELRGGEPVRLRCEPAEHPAARELLVRTLWGDPNPELVAIVVNQTERPEPMLVPLDWDLRLSISFHAGPVEIVFLRVTRQRRSAP